MPMPPQPPGTRAPRLLLQLLTCSFLANADAFPWQPPEPVVLQQPMPMPTPVLEQQPPTPPPAGEWRLLHANIGVSAMHMQLLPDDFVLMFDRTDSGPSNISLSGDNPAASPCAAPPNATNSTNSTAAAIKDCTAHSVLLDLRSNALHPYPLATNPWCSSAALLPNGTLLQTGGFSDGDRVARLFSPSSGWTDLPATLAARRWYASDLLLADARVLVLGGRRQFNFEFIPPLSPSSPPLPTFFPFLDETTEPDAENNLYPFLHQLPDATVFVFANDRAVVFNPYDDPSNPLSTRRLPPIPGGVPRNYPSSGSSVLLPLNPFFPSHAEILVCGGAPRGSYQQALKKNGTFLPADATCGRIAPTDPNPAWAMEEMPLRRVMGDMVLLPTGDVLIVNGAASGTAGWELARDPVLSPVLYRPNVEQVGGASRFEVMAATETPRMYHSAAALDTYGRVLVGGSNPHVGYAFAGVEFPTELSLQAFLPPYLDPRMDPVRPRVVAAPAEVGYGEVAAVRFEVPGGPLLLAGGGDDDHQQQQVVVRVAAVAPGFATHAFGMGQRVVGLAVGRVAEVGDGVYEAEVAAPPSPGVAPPGYYLWFVVHAGVPCGAAAWVRIRPLGAAT